MNMASSFPSDATPPLFSPGDCVTVDGMGGFGEVLKVDARRKRARVRLDRHEWVVPLARLAHAENPHEEHPSEIRRRVQIRVSNTAYYEVDLHGCYVEQALDLAERGIDQALVYHLESFKIIHGHGSGRVRLAVRQMLDKHPYVHSYRFGDPHEGGIACTVVRLKPPEYQA